MRGHENICKKEKGRRRRGETRVEMNLSRAGVIKVIKNQWERLIWSESSRRTNRQMDKLYRLFSLRSEWKEWSPQFSPFKSSAPALEPRLALKLPPPPPWTPAGKQTVEFSLWPSGVSIWAALNSPALNITAVTAQSDVLHWWHTTPGSTRSRSRDREMWAWWRKTEQGSEKGDRDVKERILQVNV